MGEGKKKKTPYIYTGFRWKVATDEKWRNDIRYGSSFKLVEMIPNSPKGKRKARNVLSFLWCVEVDLQNLVFSNYEGSFEVI